MTRRCSHCGHNGHNSRTCPDRDGILLFGVRLTTKMMTSIAMRKSASAGNLILQHTGGGIATSKERSAAAAEQSDSTRDGYASDGLVQAMSNANARERKKGVPWTEEEHRLFLLGLHRLGKGDWRGISRNYVTSRTPTQVASHAQKYFLRQANLSKRKRRSSLFDISSEVSTLEEGASGDPIERSPRCARSPRSSRPPLAPYEEKESSPSSSSSSVEIPRLWLGISTPPTPAAPARPSPAIRVEEEPEITRLSLGSPNLEQIAPISVV